MKKLIAEIQTQDLLIETVELEDPSLEKLIEMIRHKSKTEDEIFIFEKDKEEELASIEGRGAISIVVHRCKKITVQVNFEHRTETHTFSPSATVYRVLTWAIGKKGFNLDDTARAKANLIVPGEETPLPRDAAIGNYVTDKHCGLTLELTLRDFTNG